MCKGQWPLIFYLVSIGFVTGLLGASLGEWGRSGEFERGQTPAPKAMVASPIRDVPPWREVAASLPNPSLLPVVRPSTADRSQLSSPKLTSRLRKRAHRRRGSAVASQRATTRIVIDKSQHRLYFYRDGRLTRTFRVATGRFRGSTPSGTFRIVAKAHDPAWTYKGRYVPGGIAANPLGRWWMALSVQHRSGTRFGIHGTNAPRSIGKSVSRGCIRMLNKDAANLFRQVGSGTQVDIF